MNDIVKLAVDAYKGRVSGNFSKQETMDTLRQALIDANNGSTTLSYKAVRDGKCNGLFAIMEEIIAQTVIRGLADEPFFAALVDERNLALGDQNEFIAPDNSLFVVSEIADGVRGSRRQRLNGGEKKSITTTIKSIRVFEEMTRLLSGRCDMDVFIDRVSASFKQKQYEDIFDCWNGLTAASLGATYYPTAGSFSTRALMRLIQHVEAATGKTVTLVGTKLGLSLLGDELISEKQKEDLYNIGFAGRFYGTPVVSLRQIHRRDTDQFVLNDNKLIIIAAENKPVKYVTEGEATIVLGNPTDNADLTQEYFCLMKTGVAAMVNEKLGVYETTDTL